MPSDYEAITKSNIKDLGERTSSRKSQVNLYSQPTHFIYELLQNADDYGATQVELALNPDKLVLEHNGTPFEEENVRAISDFENSTSEGDETKTGRFGLGFKSVFAFTATPCVFSGDECFEIYGLYRLRKVERPGDLSKDKTRIILPFNHVTEKPDFVDQEKTPEAAYSEIGERIEDIGLTTLLFTKNVTEVKWACGDLSGHYLKEVRNNGQVYLTDGVSEETYLVFSKPVEWEGLRLNPLSIAFLMKQGRIVEAPNRSLFVLFETALETHLGFLVDGAFHTTPNRESIRFADALNKQLIQQLADFLQECLEKVKTAGLLDISCLECLPTKIDGRRKPDYPEQWPFMPLYDRIKEFLMDGEYLPADNTGEYANAGNALLARGEKLRSMFPDEVSKTIWGEAKIWLSGEITADKTPGLRQYLIHELKIKEVTPTDVLVALSEKLFIKQPWSWLVDFYVYVAEEFSRKKVVKSGSVPCIPLESGEWVGSDNKNIVFSVEEGACCDIPLLSPGVKKEAGAKWDVVKDLLEHLGVHEFDKKDQVRSIRDAYYLSNSSKLTSRKHLEHMRLFVSFWKEDKDSAKSLLDKASIFVANQFAEVGNEKGTIHEGCTINCFARAEQFYIDEPFRKTYLSDVLEAYEGNEKSVLSNCYLELGEDFVCFAETMGVQANIVPVPSEVLENPLIKQSKGSDNPNCPRTDWQLPPEVFSILDAEGADEDEVEKKYKASELVWNMMTISDSKYFQAQYQRNKYHDLQKPESMLIQQLKKLSWLPHKDGGWKRPCELTEETLHSGVADDDPTTKFDVSKVSNDWLKLVGFGQSEEMKIAFRNSGKDYNQYLLFENLMDKYPDLVNQLISENQAAEPVEPSEIDYEDSLNNKFNKPGKTEFNEEYETGGDLFSATVKNPDRVAAKLEEETAGNIEVEPSDSDRKSIRVSKTIECKDSQTKEDIFQWYKGRCQICGETWPKRDGKPYFVAAYLVEHKDGRWIDTPGNVISLCAKHFAQWRHGSKESVDNISEWIAAQKTSKEGGSFPVKLKFMLVGKPVEIEYNERHFLALRALTQCNNDSARK